MKKKILFFTLFPLGISLFSCSSKDEVIKNKEFSTVANDHFVCNLSVKCKNGDSSSLSQDSKFSSISDAESANIYLSEKQDGYKQKTDYVDVVVTSDNDESKTYQIKYKENSQNNLYEYEGDIFDLPEGSLQFKIESNLVENEIELKNEFVFPFDENDQTIFSTTNNFVANDFIRLGYDADEEMQYLVENLYIKFNNVDFGYGLDEMTLGEFGDKYYEAVENNLLKSVKYKTSQKASLEIYSKDGQYNSFNCDSSILNESVKFKNAKHLSFDLLNFVERSVINYNNKLGIKYDLKTPESLELMMYFNLNLIPHDLISVSFYQNVNSISEKHFNLVSVNDESGDERKYDNETNVGLVGYAKNTDFKNQDEIEIIFELSEYGLVHKNDINNYKFKVNSGGSVNFNSNTNQLVVKAKKPYLSNDPNYFNDISIDMIA